MWLLPLWAVVMLVLFTPFGSFSRDLHTDEAYTASYVTHENVSQLLEDVRKNEETPPIYFIATWLWSQIFGTGELALRSFSMVTILIAGGLFAYFVGLWLPLPVAWVSVTIFSVSPLIAPYLVTARAYGLTVLLTVLCIAAFEDVYRRPEDNLVLIRYALISTIFMLTSYFSLALITAHSILWLNFVLKHERREQLLRKWLLVHIGIVSAILMWLPSLAYQLRVVPAVTPFRGIQLEHYFLILVGFLMNAPPFTQWFLIWLALGLSSWCLIGLGLAHAPIDQRQLLTRTIGLPTLILLLLLISINAVGPRYLLILLPGAAIGTALGLDTFRRQSSRLWLVSVCIVIGGIISYRLPGLLRSTADHSWDELTQIVAQQAELQGDVVLVQPPFNERLFRYYYHGPPMVVLGAHHYDDFYYFQGHDMYEDWRIEQVVPLTSASKRVWVFYEPSGPDELDLPYKQLRSWETSKIRLTLYAVTDQP